MKIFTENFITAINFLKESYTQANISSKIGLHPQSLSQIMTGKRAPTVENISKLFTEFNINPIWVLTGTGNMIISKVNQPPPVTGGGSHLKQLPNEEHYKRLCKEKDQEIQRLMSIIEMMINHKSQAEETPPDQPA
jgi:transcriptional regulator with XRE-family HTH domain